MATMPQRHPRYDPNQATAKAAVPRPSAAPSSRVAEPAPPEYGQEYGIEPAWIDTAGRTRTWALRDPHGTQMAEITTKTAALKLAALLNRIAGDERGPCR